MIEAMWVVTALSNIVIAGMGWVMKSMYTEIKDLRQMIQATREDYVHRDDIRDFRQEIVQRLDRVEKLLIDSIRRE